MKRNTRILLINSLLITSAAGLVACSAVSFTHADDIRGGSITHAEVQPGNTVILTYPDGAACIDTRAHEGRDCQQMAQPVSATPAVPTARTWPEEPLSQEGDQ